MQLSVAEDPHIRQERASWLLKRIWETEAENKATEAGESTHQDKQPEPATSASDTSHVEDTEGEKLRRSLTKLVAEVEDHDSFGCLQGWRQRLGNFK